MSEIDGSGISTSSYEIPVRLDVPNVDAPVGTTWGRARLYYHAPGLALIAAVAIWLMRRFIFTTGFPAGTDMLGFISRAPQYASISRIYDAWSPGSFGYRRVFNFDNVMGGLTLLIRNPVATVTFVDVLTFFGAGVGAYVLAWFWYRRRLAATIAGLLFMASQAVLTRWGSGLLNVEVIFSLAPFMFVTLSACLERFTLKRAIGFTLAIGLGLLVRPDLELYVFPFLVLYVVITLATRHGFKARVRDLARTLAVSVPGVLLLNAAWLVPFAAGYRVGYETLNQLFSLSALQKHSLDWFQSLLGLGREIGYFNFTGAQTWYSYPWLPPWGYYAFAASIPLLALAALWWHRDRRTVFLVLAAVIATLAGPGINAPLGGLYLWAVHHVPVFGNLRDTNRWLLTQAIAYAVLAGLAIDHLATGAATLWRRNAGPPWPTAVRGAVAVTLVGIALVSVLPTFVMGLRTWHMPPSQLALLDRLHAIPSAQRVLSVPTQDTRFLRQGTYQGFEHDLGTESVLFTRRQDVADGGWEQSSANFAAYQTTLLLHQDPAFSAMLGSAGVGRVLSLNYPLIKEVANPATGIGPYSEQRAAAKIPKLTPILSNSAGTDYAIRNVTSPLSFRRNIAVVLGGSQGAAALADQPGINLSDWAVFEADDVIGNGGYNQLLTLIRRADVVLLADERPLDIAVEGTAPIATFPGITSSLQLDRLIAALPADQSAQGGSLNDVSVPIPQPQTTSAGTSFSVRSPQRVAVWARVLVSGSAATIQTHLDGAKVGSITPVTLGHGFQWVQLATAQVSPGHHQVRISAVPSTFGDNYEVQQVRVLSPSALGTAETQLNGALAAQASRVAYAFDYADVAKWSWRSLAGSLTPLGAPFGKYGWAVPRRTGTASVTTAPGGGTTQRITARPGRPSYTFAKIHYRTPENWGNRPYFYLQFKGNDSGKVYQLVVDFGLGQRNEARYTFVDDSKAWKTLAFSTSNPGPGSGATDWSRIHSIRVALPSKKESGTIALGLPRPSSPINSLKVPVSVLPGTGKFTTASARTPMCFRDFRAANTPQPRLSSGTLVIPGSDVNSPCRIFVASRAGYHQLPAVPVRIQQTGPESWSYSFSAQQPGVLVWTQAYDPLWRLTGAAGSTHFPEMSLLNGYLVSPGKHSGTIAFAGESSAIVGVLISILTGLALVLALVLHRDQAAKLLRNWWPRHNGSSDGHSASRGPHEPLRHPWPNGYAVQDQIGRQDGSPPAT